MQDEKRIPTEFGEIIRQRRWDLEMTQVEVESAAGLRAGFMSYLERGLRSTLPAPAPFARLCRALGFTLAEATELAGYLSWSDEDIPYLRRTLRGLDVDTTEKTRVARRRAA